MFCKLLVWVLTGAGSHCQQVTYSNKDVETWEGVSLLACDPDWVRAITLSSRRLFCVGYPQLDADRLVGHRISAFLGYWRYLSTQKAWGNPFIWHSIFGISCTLLLNSKWELNINFFQWNSWSLFVSLCRIYYFLSLHSTDFSAIIHHKRDIGALHNFSFLSSL